MSKFTNIIESIILSDKWNVWKKIKDIYEEREHKILIDKLVKKYNKPTNK